MHEYWYDYVKQKYGENAESLCYMNTDSFIVHVKTKDNNDEDKKAKATKKLIIKRKLKFQDYKNCLEAAQI